MYKLKKIKTKIINMISRIFHKTRYAKLKLGATLNVLGIFLILLFPSQALAVYNPSYIMPDNAFVNSGTMSEGDIENFLYNQNSYYSFGRRGFRVPPAGNRQIWDGGGVYYEGTMVGPLGREVDSTNWTAAHLIYMVSQWYGINPQVILVTIQKESSMITSSYPNYWGLVQWTTGYAYTESGIVGACKTSHNPGGSCAGFAMQVDWGGGGLKYFYNCSTSGGCGMRYYAGNTLNLDGASIYVGNHSTAAFYRYTPHNTYGGNFRTNFTNWFGSIDSDGNTAVYRFYHKGNGTHFYTASEAEKNNVIARWSSTYRFEGTAYILSTSGGNNMPLYRFYNISNGTHFYTVSAQERDMVGARWGYKYRYEGTTYYVAGAGTPVYRFYNISNGTHFYTASAEERDRVGRLWGYKFRYEGAAFYLAP